MKTMVLVILALLAGFGGVVWSTTPPIVTIDENGNGTNWNGVPLNWFKGQDPAPGGLPDALIYVQLGFAGEQGDLIILEPEGGYSDIVRFNGDGSIVFYSDRELDSGEPPELADTGFPTALYPNQVTMLEVGSEGNNWVDYMPQPGQPGFEPGMEGLTYHIISDIPEPATMTLLALGLGAALLRRRMK